MQGDAEGRDGSYVIDLPKGGFRIASAESTPSLRESLGRSPLLWILKALEWLLMALALFLTVVAATEVWRESFH